MTAALDTDYQVEGPDADGFLLFRFQGEGHNTTYGPVRARAEGDGCSRVRVPTSMRNGNATGALHGGFLLSFLDHALFMGPIAAGRLTMYSAVTLAVSTQFVGAGRIDRPLDCVVEIVRETGRLMFLRGTLEQDGAVVLTYQATLRKMSAPA